MTDDCQKYCSKNSKCESLYSDYCSSLPLQNALQTDICKKYLPESHYHDMRKSIKRKRNIYSE